mmetsp:Transcript_26420/g.40906  ORF Transcript_26420/g.40906 Transcript_26420/m.40906 type:complete len:448 (+) Transcript_26420:35-1378(+)
MSFTREIPALRSLSLRAIGSGNCDPAVTFTSLSEKERSTTSRLLARLSEKQDGRIFTPKKNANDVDLVSPWIAVSKPSPYGDDLNLLVIEGGNSAVDCLQSYIDALVDLGRMQDGKLGVVFFKEWRLAVLGYKDADDVSNNNYPKKRKRGAKQSDENTKASQIKALPLGALSLHNCANIGMNTLGAMKEANIGSVLGALDLTGVHALTDKILTDLVNHCPRIRRLSIKNCRKVTGVGLTAVAKGLPDLRSIDMGGSFNITPADVIELAKLHPGTAVGTFTEIHASGLNWSDEFLEVFIDLVKGHLTGLSIGFSPRLTAARVAATLGQVGETLTSLSMHFCDCMTIDLSIQLGKLLPKLRVIDIRGAGSINSITPMLDARAASVGGYGRVNEGEAGDDNFPVVFVLARYTGITSSSLVDTRAVHSYDFECIIDGGGLGSGIRRLDTLQ